MLSRRRVLVALPLLALVLAGLYTAWLVRAVEHDLTAAQARADDLRSAIDAKDAGARGRAVRGLQQAASSADRDTGGAWWALMAHLPVVGDDATGIRALSSSLDTLAKDGVAPLTSTLDSLDRVSRDGGIDLRVVRDLTAPVARAHVAFARAQADVSGLDSSGYAGPLKTKFDRYTELVGQAAAALGSAQRATEVLPAMAGGDGPRDYLLVFQNNAEIRATGGMPGSWAELHADAGKLTLTRQGAAGSFGGERTTPVLPLSKAETTLYGRQLGTYFQDAGFTPDFPRAAQLLAARWSETYPDHLDGVISLDPVALSYLLDGTGPVQVAGLTLTRANVVEELLNKPYVELAPGAQDALFQQAARAIFDATTSHLVSPVKFVTGLNRAASEGRFLVAPFAKSEREAIAGTRVTGALAGDDGSTPHVDIGVNDATGSKMSYYLRYWADVQSTSCQGGVQTLDGSMTLNQAISPEDAKALPASVTGTGNYGTDPGTQLVLVRLYSPYGGTIDSLRVEGKTVDDPTIVDLDGRQAVTAVVLLSNRDDVVVTWTMHSGPGQTKAARLGVTPSVVPGNGDKVVPSAC